jgi:hypothetical protein
MGPGLRRDGEKGNSQIVTIFVEANWVTASFAGKVGHRMDHPNTSKHQAAPSPGCCCCSSGKLFYQLQRAVRFRHPVAEFERAVAVWEMNGSSVTGAAILASPGPSWHA